MPEGFFTDSSLQVISRKGDRTQPQCGRCGLYKAGCRTPKMAVAGKGKKGILVVGEAPGENEDRQGKPFVGVSGQLLQDELRRCDVELFTDCWVTNALRCRPSASNKIKDAKAIDYCRPYLLQAIKQYQPRTIILLGKNAVKSLIEHLWGGGVDAVHRWAGYQIPCQRYNAWVCPTFHPAHVLREEQDTRQGSVTKLHFRHHLEQALAKTKRPWKEVPDFKSQVQIELDDDNAAQLIYHLHSHADEIAFDFETNMLKPDSSAAEIVTCSMSDGITSIAYPMYGKAVEATKKILSSPTVAKLGWNLKFEERWAYKKLSCVVRNWKDDGQLKAHCQDSRRSTTSLDFQAFVQLGQEDYCSWITPYLEAEGGNTKNRIRDLNIEDLLIYNAMDSLLEFNLVQKQRKKEK
jgi:uracil-DNA glycosylase family 4